MLGTTSAKMTAMVLGLGLPEDKDKVAIKNSEFWRIILGFPFITITLCMFGMIFLVRNETVKFLVIKKRDSEALAAIKCVYHKDEPHDEILDHLRANTQKKTDIVSLKDAMCNLKYRRATWVLIGFVVLHEFTGYGPVVMYSKTMFKRMSDKGSALTPKEGTYFVGIIIFLSEIASIFIVNRLRRR
jgi:hypothetical protein